MTDPNPKPYSPVQTFAIIRIYGYAGTSHIVITNIGIKSYGARLPPLFAAWLSDHESLEYCRFINNSILIYGDDFFHE